MPARAKPSPRRKRCWWATPRSTSPAPAPTAPASPSSPPARTARRSSARTSRTSISNRLSSSSITFEREEFHHEGHEWHEEERIDFSEKCFHEQNPLFRRDQCVQVHLSDRDGRAIR